MPYTATASYTAEGWGPGPFEHAFTGLPPDVISVTAHHDTERLQITVVTRPVSSHEAAISAADDAAATVSAEIVTHTAQKWVFIGPLARQHVIVADERGVGAGGGQKTSQADTLVADPILPHEWKAVEAALAHTRRASSHSWDLLKLALQVREPIAQFSALYQAFMAETWDRLPGQRQQELRRLDEDPRQREMDELIVKPLDGDGDWLVAWNGGRESPYMHWRNRMMHPRRGDTWPVVAEGIRAVLPRFRSILARACRR